MRLTLVISALAMLLASSVQSVLANSLDVDHIDGLFIDVDGDFGTPGTEYLDAGSTIQFKMRLTSTEVSKISSITNGFRVYSPDGASWQPITMVDLYPAGLGPSFFDLYSQFHYAGVTGTGADTAGYAGSSLAGSGINPGFDDLVFAVQTAVSVSQVGRTICIDSAYVPPNLIWLWAGGFGSTLPDWDGPYCYEVQDSAFLNTGSFDVDHIEGTWSDGSDTYLHTDRDIKYFLRMQTQSLRLYGATNGFRVYSPDGAIWLPAVVDTIEDHSQFFDLAWYWSGHSLTGNGADTLGYSGSIIGVVFPQYYDKIVASIDTRVTAEQIGKSLCIDSSYFPPSGPWLWVGAFGSLEPYWGGPYCYEIKSCCVLRGDVDGDGLVATISDVVALNAYMFGHAELDCPERGDWDGSGGVVDIADLVAFVQYMFMGGPPPTPCP